MVKVKIPQIACNKVLKQNCNTRVLSINQKLKKMNLTSLVVITEKKLTEVGKKRLQLKKCILLLDNVFS